MYVWNPSPSTDNTKSEIHALKSSNEPVREVNNPLPAGIEEPVNEKPITPLGPEATSNPLSEAEPPEAPSTFIPLTENWNPVTG